MIITTIAPTPLHVGDGTTGPQYFLRYNHRAMRLFEERTGRRCFTDFFVECQAGQTISARDLIALVWAGLEGYKVGQVPAETVEEWINPGNEEEFAAVCTEACEKAWQKPDSKQKQKKT